MGEDVKGLNWKARIGFLAFQDEILSKGYFLLNLFLNPISPTSPEPRRSMVAGSGVTIFLIYTVGLVAVKKGTCVQKVHYAFRGEPFTTFSPMPPQLPASDPPTITPPTLSRGFSYHPQQNDKDSFLNPTPPNNCLSPCHPLQHHMN